MSTGMPRPLSRMEMEPSTWTVKSMRVQWPARYSSTELSSTSDLNLVFRVNVHRDAAAVIPNGDGAVHMDRQVDASAMAGQVFVHRIVEHFSDAMMQGALIRAANVHAGLFANRLQPLQFAQFGSVV